MTINLIPPQLKKEKQIKRVANLCLFALEMILVVLIFVSIAIFLANYFCKKDISSVRARILDQEITIAKYKDLEDKTSETNQKLDKIDKAMKEKTIWSNIITDLANDTPQRLQIKTLSASKDTNKITLTGIAETRREIASFKEKLEKSNYFKNVTFYSSVYNNEGSNFSFNLSCELENYK